MFQEVFLMGNEDCIFCKIVAGDTPAEVVYEDEDILAFKDVKPAAPIHILIIPKKHIPTLTDVSEEDAELIGRIHLAAQKVAKDFDIYDRGFRFINNCKDEGGQVIYHLHFHLLAGKKFEGVC